MLNKKTSLIVIFMAFIVISSCKKEFTDIGSNMIDTPHFEGKLFEASKIITYDEAVDKVYSKNIATPALGYYNDPVFGNLQANVVTTIGRDLTRFVGDLGDNTKILDAKLIIPYYSHTYDDNGTKKYDLDSIYGNHQLDIKVYELTYLLPSYDPNNNLQTYRSYFSDFDFNPFKGQQIADSIGFYPSEAEYIVYKRESDGTFSVDTNGNRIEDEKLSPRMVIKLDTLFFRHKIFDHSDEDVLTNDNLFKDYFRGIYIDAQPHNNDGPFMLLNFNDAKIQIEYTYDKINDNGTPNDPSDDTQKTFTRKIDMPFGKPRVNMYQNNHTTNMQTAINNSDLINGDPQVYVKGDAGAETTIELFDTQQLSELRQKDWLINHAELYVYVDEAASTDILKQADKLVLYDKDNEAYLIDISAPENNENHYKAFSGLLQEDKNGNKYYKFGVTRHIRNVISKDSTNVKLGLRVRSNMSFLKSNDVFVDPDGYNPAGIILHGNQTTDTSKKPVLKIYYSDPE